MKNRGQTTVFYSLIIGVLLVLTFTALEVVRIYCGRVKIRAVLHSARTSIMADYNRDLFERYHLLFMDPTYGTGSDAMVEEKFADYVIASLDADKEVYSCSLKDVALVSKKTIMDDHMKLLKKQITEYETKEGLIKKATELPQNVMDNSKEVSEASDTTKRNATVIPEDNNVSEEEKEEHFEKNEEQVDDPRDVLKSNLSLGVLALVLPEGTTVSKDPQDFSNSPSSEYKEEVKEDKDASFSDVGKMTEALDDIAKESSGKGLGMTSKLAFASYVLDHFSYQGKEMEGSDMKCETEYILKGKDNDYANLEAVLNEIIWTRMPVNYLCIMQDEAKQGEALTLATAICTATGTMPMVEIVKYLLMGCWSYGESISEVRALMHGEKLPYVKTPDKWRTDLKTLCDGNGIKEETGMAYKDYLYLMLLRKESKDVTYARMLDVIEKNLKQENLSVVNLCGELIFQGEARINNFFRKEEDESYSYYFEEKVEY
ncbi:MAG: DUF5702 domain-containing protein [Lachnospiraceae bacterium]|nr:DUF5702 domain-containing protein [Lachnospiraceae bacterium]